MSVSVSTRSPLLIGSRQAYPTVMRPRKATVMAPAHSGHGSQVEYTAHPSAVRDRSASIWAMAFSLARASHDPRKLTTWRVARIEDAVARLGGNHTVRVNHDRAARNGAGGVSGPRPGERRYTSAQAVDSTLHQRPPDPSTPLWKSLGLTPALSGRRSRAAAAVC
jgi:hypothetical protein